ncbi:MAG TPA: hypothetical protein VHB20_14540 [Verrucomicrobiae bacterium]|jgi:hypothetical protein|nr:hypothetical protein [Verrucomicrobiae bacterium]
MSEAISTGGNRGNRDPKSPSLLPLLPPVKNSGDERAADIAAFKISEAELNLEGCQKLLPPECYPDFREAVFRLAKIKGRLAVSANADGMSKAISTGGNRGNRDRKSPPSAASAASCKKFPFGAEGGAMITELLTAFSPERAAVVAAEIETEVGLLCSEFVIQERARREVRAALARIAVWTAKTGASLTGASRDSRAGKSSSLLPSLPPVKNS